MSKESDAGRAAESLFADFLARADAGERVDFEGFLAAHPECAGALERLHLEWREFGGVLERAARELAPEASLQPTPGARFDKSTHDPLDGLSETLLRSERYRRQSCIGRGGMGEVFRVWDQVLRRPLAMKVVLEKGSESARHRSPEFEARVLSRFLDEALITGQLVHPGIVPVHELGTDESGRVYFTMRLVEGHDLSQVIEHVHARKDGWTLVRALGVLVKVCEALAYAHARGVVHRDIKPSNIMVGQYGEAYLMDWGCARVLDQSNNRGNRVAREQQRASEIQTLREDYKGANSDSPVFTAQGDVIGTPAYMSPEQARGELDSVGVRSDVYSLGALLYHLLAGRMPYLPDEGMPSNLAVLQWVLDGPPRDLRALAPNVPDELVAIAQMAMQRAPDARYADAQAVASELQAYLEGRVVQAHQTGAWAEASKWIKRNRALAASLVTVVVVSLVGLVAFAVKATVAKQNEAEAIRAKEREMRVTELLQNTLTGFDPNQEGAQGYRVVDAMEDAIQRLESGELDDDLDTKAALLVTISTILHGNGRAEEALRLAEQASEIRNSLFQGDHPDLGESLRNTAACLISLGRSDEALPKAEAALAMYARMHAGDHADMADSLNTVGTCLNAMGRSGEALPMLEAALAMWRRVYQPDHQRIAIGLSNTASCLGALGRYSEALATHEEALKLWQHWFEGDHPRVAGGINNVAASLSWLNRHEESLPRFEAALSMWQRLFQGNHPQVATALCNVASELQYLGRTGEALPKAEESLEMRRRMFKGDHLDIATSLHVVAVCLQARGKPEEALPLYEAALGMRERLYRYDHADVAVSLNSVGACLRTIERYSEALAKDGPALQMRQRLYPRDSLQVAEGMIYVGADKIRLDQAAEALGLFERALEIHQHAYSGANHTVASNIESIGVCFYKLGRFSEALSRFEASLEMRELLRLGDDPAVVENLRLMAQSHLELGNLGQALDYAEEAEEMALIVLPVDHPTRKKIEVLLERIRQRLDDEDSSGWGGR